MAECDVKRFNGMNVSCPLCISPLTPQLYRDNALCAGIFLCNLLTGYIHILILCTHFKIIGTVLQCCANHYYDWRRYSLKGGGGGEGLYMSGDNRCPDLLFYCLSDWGWSQGLNHGLLYRKTTYTLPSSTHFTFHSQMHGAKISHAVEDPRRVGDIGKKALVCL